MKTTLETCISNYQNPTNYLPRKKKLISITKLPPERIFKGRTSDFMFPDLLQISPPQWIWVESSRCSLRLLHPPYLDSIISFQSPPLVWHKCQIHFPSKARLNNLILRMPRPPTSSGSRTLSQATHAIFLSSNSQQLHKKFLCRVTIFFTTVEGILNKDKKNSGTDEINDLTKKILPAIKIKVPFQVLNLDLILSTTPS